MRQRQAVRQFPASPRIRSATSEKAASSGETRRRVRIGLSARGRSKAKPDSILSTHGQQSVSALLGHLVPFGPRITGTSPSSPFNWFPSSTYDVLQNREIEGIVNTEKINSRLTAKIVKSYIVQHRVRPEQFSDLITSVNQALGQLGLPIPPQEVLVPAVSVRRSVHQDYVVCLDCGYRGKTLRRHISTSHGLNRDEYLSRWRLRSDHALTARLIPSAAPRWLRRSGSVANGQDWQRRRCRRQQHRYRSIVDQRSQATPSRGRTSRAASKSADVASATIAATPTRRRRSRSASKSLTPDGGNEAAAERQSRRRDDPRSRVGSP